VRYLMLAL